MADPQIVLQVNVRLVRLSSSLVMILKILDPGDILTKLQVRLPRAWCGGRRHLGKNRLAGRRAHTEDPCVQGIHEYLYVFFSRANAQMEYQIENIYD